MIRQLDVLQDRFAEWRRHNFGYLDDTFWAAKLLEEAGEAGHAVVRLALQAQGKKVNPNSEEMLRDALGDVMVVLMALADNHGWLLSEVFQEVADEVLARDYTEHA